MYISDTRLPHLLAPPSYYSSAVYRDELSSVLQPSWHVVGTTAELARPGDFVTRNVAGVSIQVRNFHGQLRALSNVCAHRHAEICSLNEGHTSTMRCQYHGWEYQQDGRTTKIPAPKNFTPIDRESTRLPCYRLETAGQLVFVNVDSGEISLSEFLGNEFYQLLCQRFSEEWSLVLRWQPDYPVNWKIPIENSLEAYHVPAVHPRTFRQDPGAERSQHGLLPNRTWLKTQLPFSPHTRLDAAFQALEGRFVSWLGYPKSGLYEQHHVFPNLLFSFTDAISLVNCVLPRGAKHCSAVVRQFGRLPLRRGFGRTLIAKLWNRMNAAITKRIFLEDLEIFAAIQRGLEHSPHVGVLGCCEERIHRFQEFMVARRNV